MKSFLLAAVNRVINETIAYDKIPFTTVLHCNFTLPLNFNKSVLYEKHHIDKNTNIASLFV